VHANLARAAEGAEQELFSGNHYSPLTRSVGEGDRRRRWRGLRHHCLTAMPYNRLKPWIVRSGSIASNTFVCLSNNVASPPVVTTVTGLPSSLLMRSVNPSSIAT